ncbi:hypothetical protein ONZ43_g1215 [Nemania bipapillata]|uniref:Uncharacterized protein n=1 Tax=Nemania bipapillata TaxID=110536 RepID=A0ACC2J5N9_9PEZI|nr:hypothetical protein ONZ43_g1215 [Nemania bipapillata]
MQAKGGKLAFAEVYVPGRTPKALMHLWDKLSKEHADPAAADAAGDEDTGTAEQLSTPKGKQKAGGTPGSRKRTAATAAINEGDEPASPASTPKRQRKPAGPRKKGRIASAVDEDEGEGEETKPEKKDLDDGDA